MQQEDAASSQLLVDLFSDDYLCRTFGFAHYVNFGDVKNLLYLYGYLFCTFKSATGLLMTGEGNTGNFIEVWATLLITTHVNIPLAIAIASDGFSNNEPQILKFQIGVISIYQGIGLRKAEHNFSVPPADDDPEPLSPGEGAVVLLYSQLFRLFNNVPDVYSLEWANFGFCFCRSWDQRKRLVNAYLELAERGVSLGKIL